MSPLRSVSLSRARELRKSQTDAEAALWRRLRRRGLDGLKFRRQETVGAYIVDFLCAEARLVVELDGGGHDAEERRRYDARRTQVLEQFGLRVLRFWNNDVHQNVDGVLMTILEAARTPHPDPLPRRRGRGKQ